MTITITSIFAAILVLGAAVGVIGLVLSLVVNIFKLGMNLPALILGVIGFGGLIAFFALIETYR